MVASNAYKTKARAAGKTASDGIDLLSGANVLISEREHRANAGNRFGIVYNVTDIGALTTPNDTMTLSFTTPNSAVRLKMDLWAYGPAGARVQLIAGKTGGGTSPSGTITSFNINQNSSNNSVITDVAGANATKVSYDALVFTGGTTIFDEYITGLLYFEEKGIILAKNIIYQFLIIETGNVPATLKMRWSEHA